MDVRAVLWTLNITVRLSFSIITILRFGSVNIAVRAGYNTFILISSITPAELPDADFLVCYCIKAARIPAVVSIHAVEGELNRNVYDGTIMVNPVPKPSGIRVRLRLVLLQIHLFIQAELCLGCDGDCSSSCNC